MIDIKHLRGNPDPYQDSVRRRGAKVDINALIKLDGERTKLIGTVDELRAKLNIKGKPSADELKALQASKTELESLDKEFAGVDEKYQDLLWRVPNLIADGTPDGGEEANREESKWGQAEKIDGAKDHLELATELDLLDFERGAKVAGAKFLFSKGQAVRLEMSVMRLVMDRLEAAGFTLMGVPHMTNSRVAEGTGFLPRGEERQVYRIDGEDLNLIATSEIPLTGYHMDEILDPGQLPLAYAGISPCYRLEAGTYGKHSKGYYRVHQFNKLEMYVYAAPDDSETQLAKILKLQEDICRALEIPYRVTRTASGDLSAPAYKKFDLEYYSPVDGSYRELTSCSNCTDYQARRLNIRTKDDSGKTIAVHTLNGTAIAFSRVFIALVENHQQSDGSVRVPEALQPYYGGKTL